MELTQVDEGSISRLEARRGRRPPRSNSACMQPSARPGGRVELRRPNIKLERSRFARYKSARASDVKLFRVLGLTVAKRPVFFADFNQTNEHVLPTQAEAHVQSVRDCFVKGTLLVHGSPRIERDLDKYAIFDLWMPR